MIKKSVQRIIILVLTVGFLVNLNPVITYADQCTGGPLCRRYSIIGLTNVSTYTAVHSYIEWANPSIRDGGFSAQAIWIGALTTKQNVVEAGWRKYSDGSIHLYWGYYDPSGGWHYYDAGSINRACDYQIEHRLSDNKWHISFCGVENGWLVMPISSGTINVGAELTDYQYGVHNAMGIAASSNISYMNNHTGYYSINGWSWTNTDVGYHFYGISGNAFQDYGYNP